MFLNHIYISFDLEISVQEIYAQEMVLISKRLKYMHEVYGSI